MKNKNVTDEEYERALDIVLREHDKYTKNNGGHRLIIPERANLYGALFNGVNFSGAFFKECNFAGAAFDGTDLRQILCDDRTKFPEKSGRFVRNLDNKWPVR